MATITFQRRRHLSGAAFDGCFSIPDCFASYDSILLVSRVQKACPRPDVRETSSIRQSNGLLIRRFGVRFPGLPPLPRKPRTSSQSFGTSHSQSNVRFSPMKSLRISIQDSQLDTTVASPALRRCIVGYGFGLSISPCRQIVAVSTTINQILAH